MKEGAGTQDQVATDQNKGNGKNTQVTASQETKRPSWKGEGVGEQILNPTKELTTMKKGHIW